MTPVVLDAREVALAALLDDATTVPPGRVDLAAALVAQLVHRREPHAWTLGRFVVSPLLAQTLRGHLPTAWAQVDAAVVEQGGSTGPAIPLPIAVVLPRSGVANLPPTLPTDLAGMASLAADPGVDLRSIEVALVGPDPAGEIDIVVAEVSQAGLAGRVEIVGEVPLAGRPAGEVVRRVQALAEARQRGTDLVAKLPLSGTMPAAIPSATEVGGFLRACARLALPVRAAGGRRLLSAPRPQGEPGARVEHGILNLLGAAVVARHGGALADIVDVVLQAPDHVRLGSGALIVGEAVLESEVLVAARQDLLRGVGCADLDGLLAQLVAMGAVTRAEPTS